MRINYYETVSIAINDLKKRGFSSTFTIDQGQAICLETKQSFLPTEMTIIEYHRFEGDSSADDMSILYVLTCTNGVKGIILDAYGTYSDTQLSDFLKHVPFIDGLS